MHTDKSIYVSYLKKRDKAYLYDTLNVASPRFVDDHISDLKECQEAKDAELLEYQLIPLFLFKNAFNLNDFTQILNELLVETWHRQHENIALLLEDIHDPKSVKYLAAAFDLHPDYLAWDEFKSFERKCIWALGRICNEESITVLRELSSREAPISDYAQKQLDRLNG